MSSADPDGSHFIQLVCLVSFNFFPFSLCCQFLALVLSSLTFYVVGGGGVGIQFEQIANETVKSVCIYYLVFFYFLY